MNRTRNRPVRSRASRLAELVVLRCLLVLFSLILLVFVGLCVVLNTIFNGPSESARNVLTMSMLESSGMKWCPGIFIGQDKVNEIKANISAELPSDISKPGSVVIRPNDNTMTSEWKDYPDGIRIEKVSGDSYNAYVMIVRDPSRVYQAVSNENFTTEVPGNRITQQIEIEGAVAGINAGAFFDNGTTSTVVGSVPQGLVIAGGKVVWNEGWTPETGFVGFDNENRLIVAQSMTASKALQLGIRDGCEFGPVLIMDGVINMETYNSNSGWNPRTAIGQRADGAVLMVCIDGRQAGSLGGSYADMIDIMTEYGAVNACNLDGGSSTVMLYRDEYGRYGEPGQVQMINSLSMLQAEPRRAPTFFMVRPLKEG